MRTKTALRLSILAVMGPLLTACVFFPNAHDRAVRRSSAFKDGYADGCAAATAPSSNYREGPWRDEALYKTDSRYRAGWASGYQSCGPVQRGNGVSPDANPIGGNIPGH